MKDVFNDGFLGGRCAPAVSEDLADRIIAAALLRGQGQDRLVMWLLIPRPFLIMSVLFCLSLFAGMGFDMGFNSAEALYVSEGDMLLSFDEDAL